MKSMLEESWDAVIDVNLKGVFLVTRAVVPHMIRQGGGVILSAASVVALNGNFGQTNYVASKAGVIGMTRTWARELGKHNIRVNAVAPGFIATDMLKSMPPDILDNMVSHTPVGRVGTPEDVANAYFWLASDQASFVHGTDPVRRRWRSDRDLGSAFSHFETDKARSRARLLSRNAVLEARASGLLSTCAARHLLTE